MGFNSGFKELFATQHLQQTDIHTPGDGVRTHNLSRRAAADPHLRRRGNWDRPLLPFTVIFIA